MNESERVADELADMADDMEYRAYDLGGKQKADPTARQRERIALLRTAARLLKAKPCPA